ncbi:MAG: prohibitin family protein [Leptospiraceae bacterium]|nr:prohibitin family protein [Leptospiraceae bacterium]
MDDLKTRFSGKAFLIGGIVVAVLFFLLFLNPFVIINAGERGVVTNFGSVQDYVLDEGLHMRIPIVQQVHSMDVKINKIETKAAASTMDLQDTHSTIALNYHILPEKVNKIYQDIGLSYKARIIDPSIQEVVKAVTAMFTAKELITRREEVSAKIKELLSKKISPYHIKVDNFSIVDFSFSKQFTQAIEDKQTAEQKALKAEQDLKRVEFEAKQKVELARAEAKALELQRAVTTNQVLELRRIEANLKAIEKWNGILPRVTSGAVPFLNIKED